MIDDSPTGGLSPLMDMRCKLTKAEKRIEQLEDQLHQIRNWCKAYPRTVFIEPTKEGWAEANRVLDAAEGCPSLTAISGSNMRHVVEGLEALAKLQEKTCAGCGNKWNHDTVWCPECAIKRADKLQEQTRCRCGRELDTVGRCEYHGLPAEAKLQEQKDDECKGCIGIVDEHTCKGWQDYQDLLQEQK